MIVIHIGLKKAGSTSLQAFLQDNEDQLRCLSVDYARIGRSDRSAHHNLASEIQGRKKFDPCGGTVADLTDYWRTAPSRSLVISSEMFEEAEVQQISAMRDTLSRARGNEEFRIVLIIRDLISLIPSIYAQKVKYGFNIHEFDSFFAERMQERRINCFDTARRWAEVFGWGNIGVRLLDREHLINGELSDDFLRICGIELSARAVPLVKREDISNVAPGWKTLEALRAIFSGKQFRPAIHCLTKKIRPKDRRMVARCAITAGKRLGWNDDRGRYLTRAQAQRCLEIYRANVETLNEHLSVFIPIPANLDSRGFREREFLPDVGRIRTSELRAFYEIMETYVGRAKA